ncbi:MAG: phosphoenolpyruvate carboxylase [Bdellovibrionales bacterium]|nr:phosphoenolpyruvate carboxylase [Bdellovibrionales bacterium]
MNEQQHLPKSLKSLVKTSVSILGKCIKQVYGLEQYNRVEKLRTQMKSLRTASVDDVFKELKKLHKGLEKLSDEKLLELAHCFGLYFEIINRCERAYRHKRLLEKNNQPIKHYPYAIIYVFTAHPTEARSPQIRELFEHIEQCLLSLVENESSSKCQNTLEYFINLALRVPMSKRTRPSVEDEAQNIFSTVLNPKVLEEQIELRSKKITLHFRTWVGGDKDGHPFVNEKTLFKSLSLSRSLLLDYALTLFKTSYKFLKLAESEAKIKTLRSEFDMLESHFLSIKDLKNQDGKKMKALRLQLDKVTASYQSFFNRECPYLEKLNHLLWLYPGLVLPVEIREDSELVHKALDDKSLAIAKMLELGAKISEGYNPKWYIRGFVLSMTEEDKDLIAGIKLAESIFTKQPMPVVPLFETRKALEAAPQILKSVFNSQPQVLKRHKDLWSNRFEVMLGYSDSSKESGVLASRFLIKNALKGMDNFFKKQNLTPVYFHGSGGSVERGGGSIKEQTSWWPKSALYTYKATVQGEMVARTFSDSVVMSGQVKKIIKEFSTHKKVSESKELNNVLKKWSHITAKKYSDLIKDPMTVDMVKAATPYMYLNQLKIGSRPSKRAAQNSQEFKLRAIPWVLCWTQSRLLMPTWYGVGSAWAELSEAEQFEVLKSAESSAFISSFLKVLGFTLSKVELGVFKYHLYQNMPTKQAALCFSQFEEEFNKTKNCLNTLSRKRKLMWFRPWLSESIKLRSSMIHPLNVIQTLAIDRSNEKLLKETVTAIACGMMTTG